MRKLIVLFFVLGACASGETGDYGYPAPDETHPSANLSDQFFPGGQGPTGSKGQGEFFSKKCSPRSPSNHYSKTEYFCDQR